MFLRIIHVTRYHYSQPVGFGPHAIYLRPRESPRLRLHRFELTLSPDARRIATTDAADNAVEWAYFPAQAIAPVLEVRAESLVETFDGNPFDFFLKPTATTFPFPYEDHERHVLAPALALPAGSDPASLQDWLTRHLPTPPSDTIVWLSALNTAVKTSLEYNIREEPGIQTPAETLASGRGSCRDYAVLFIALCRSLGIAARFVSGYLYEPPVPGQPATPPNLHAWAEVYLPGGGWRGLDPTHGVFCHDAYVPLAHAVTAASINPIQGAFFGAQVTARMHSVLTLHRS